MFIYLKKTKVGLNLRTIGENPAVADAVGISVVKYKYINVLIGGGICGIGGAFCSMVINGGVWMANSVNGLGWIAVALVIFAVWNPARALVLIITSVKKSRERSQPQSCGINYFREER